MAHQVHPWGIHMILEAHSRHSSCSCTSSHCPRTPARHSDHNHRSSVSRHSSVRASCSPPLSASISWAPWLLLAVLPLFPSLPQNRLSKFRLLPLYLPLPWLALLPWFMPMTPQTTHTWLSPAPAWMGSTSSTVTPCFPPPPPEALLHKGFQAHFGIQDIPGQKPWNLGNFKVLAFI